MTVALSCLCPNKPCISHLLSKAAPGVLCSEAHMLNILMMLSVLKHAHVEDLGETSTLTSTQYLPYLTEGLWLDLDL